MNERHNTNKRTVTDKSTTRCTVYVIAISNLVLFFVFSRLRDWLQSVTFCLCGVLILILWRWRHVWHT